MLLTICTISATKWSGTWLRRNCKTQPWAVNRRPLIVTILLHEFSSDIRTQSTRKTKATKRKAQKRPIFPHISFYNSDVVHHSSKARSLESPREKLHGPMWMHMSSSRWVLVTKLERRSRKFVVEEKHLHQVRTRADFQRTDNARRWDIHISLIPTTKLSSSAARRRADSQQERQKLKFSFPSKIR